MCRLRPIFAGVAQAVEQRIRNAWVGGSNPSTGIPTSHFEPTPIGDGNTLVMRVAPAGFNQRVQHLSIDGALPGVHAVKSDSETGVYDAASQ